MSSSNRTRRKPKIHSIALFLVTLINLVNLIVGSPVFSHSLQFSQFQAARNIRNLPCVVRRSGLKGVCMFAIDCLKSNGTHLGTCIDKFYFGSCCQIKNSIDGIYNPELDDNRIDSGYEKPFTTVTTLAVPSSMSSTSVHPSPSSSYSSWRTTTSRPSTMVYNNTTYELISTSSSHAASSSTEKYGASAGSFSTTLGLILNKNATAQRDEVVATTESIKISTYQSVQQTLNKTETPFPETTTSYANLTTTRPIIQTTTTNRTVSVTRKPAATKPSSRPTVRPTKGPSARPTPQKRPVSTTSNQTTQKPTTSAPQRKTTKPAKISSIKTTQKPLTSVTQKPLNRRPVSNSTTSKTTTKVNRRPTTTASTTKLPTTTSSTLTTVSFVQTTKAPRPRPEPTAEIVKVEPSTISDEDIISTTFTVESEDTTISPSTTTKKSTTKTSTRRTTTATRRVSTTKKTPATTSRKPVTTKKPEPIKTTLPITRRPPVTISKITTKPVGIVSTMVMRNRTETTRRPISSTVESTITSQKIQQQQDATTSSPSGLITWTVMDTQEDNTTKGSEWILISSLLPSSLSATTRLPVNIDSENLIKTDDSEDDRLTTLEGISTERTSVTNQSSDAEMTSSTEGFVSASMSTVSSTISQMLSSLSTYLPLSTSASTSGSTFGKVNTTVAPATHSSSSQSLITNSRPQIAVWTTNPMTTTTTTAEPTTVEEEEEDEEEEEESGETDEESEEEETDETEAAEETTTEMSEISETTKGPEGVEDTSKEEIYTGHESSTAGPTTVPTMVNETSTLEPTSAMPSLEGIDYKQICGKRMYPQARIVGGKKASFGRWPWQVSLRQWRTSTYLHKCGAALLNENWAITAAHCVDNVPPSDLLLRLGEYDLAVEEEPYGYQERRVQIVASHPQFDPRTFEYDLALLRFYEPVTFQPNIIPVCVPETDENFIGRTAYVTGWGRLYEDGPLPSVLQEVEVPVIENHLCEGMYRQAGYIEHIPHIFICAGWKKGGFDSCEGDSGGPMVIERNDKRFQLSGVISWGIGCAEPNQPGVYTRISEFRDWINQILQF